MTKTKNTFKDITAWLDSRFAKIALRGGFSTAGDLSVAYRQQLCCPVESAGIRTLPQIVLELGLMSYTQIDAVLRQMFDGADDRL